MLADNVGGNHIIRTILLFRRKRLYRREDGTFIFNHFPDDPNGFVMPYGPQKGKREPYFLKSSCVLIIDHHSALLQEAQQEQKLLYFRCPNGNKQTLLYCSLWSIPCVSTDMTQSSSFKIYKFHLCEQNINPAIAPDSSKKLQSDLNSSK